MNIDDPPLPSDPHFHKKKIAHSLQEKFELFDGKIPSPLAELKKPSLTLGKLAEWCFKKQTG
jgi:hypothetical protein